MIAIHIHKGLPNENGHIAVALCASQPPFTDMPIAVEKPQGGSFACVASPALAAPPPPRHRRHDLIVAGAAYLPCCCCPYACRPLGNAPAARLLLLTASCFLLHLAVSAWLFCAVRTRRRAPRMAASTPQRCVSCPPVDGDGRPTIHPSCLPLLHWRRRAPAPAAFPGPAVEGRHRWTVRPPLVLRCLHRRRFSPTRRTQLSPPSAPSSRSSSRTRSSSVRAPPVPAASPRGHHHHFLLLRCCMGLKQAP